MKIILIKRVEKLGQAGEVKEVTNGYGRNFLIPRGLALLATPPVVHQWQNKLKADKKNKEKELSAAKKSAKGLARIIIEIKAKANKEGKLFGSISEQQIINLLKIKDINLTAKDLDYSEHIKALGEYEVSFSLRDGSKGKLKIKVEAE